MRLTQYKYHHFDTAGGHRVLKIWVQKLWAPDCFWSIDATTRLSSPYDISRHFESTLNFCYRRSSPLRTMENWGFPKGSQMFPMPNKCPVLWSQLPRSISREMLCSKWLHCVGNWCQGGEASAVAWANCTKSSVKRVVVWRIPSLKDLRQPLIYFLLFSLIFYIHL